MATGPHDRARARPHGGSETRADSLTAVSPDPAGPLSELQTAYLVLIVALAVALWELLK